jgi:hypothetical protein
MTKVIVLSHNNKFTNKFYDHVKAESDVEIERVANLASLPTYLDENDMPDLMVMDWNYAEEFPAVIREIEEQHPDLAEVPTIALHGSPNNLRPQLISDLKVSFNCLGVLPSNSEYLPRRGQKDKTVLHRAIDIIGYMKDEFPTMRPDDQTVNALLLQDIDYARPQAPQPPRQHSLMDVIWAIA